MSIFRGWPSPSCPCAPAASAMLTIGLVVGGLITVGSSASAQTIITACVNTKSGAVSLISKGSCKKGTSGVVLNPGALQTLAVQTLNVVDSNNHTVATLGKNSSGNQLTFFDASGKQTLTVGNGAGELTAGLETWDNNDVIPTAQMRNGVVRTFFGETAGMDPLLGNAFPGGQGFGGAVFGGLSERRIEFGLQGSTNDSYFTAFHPNGSSAGIGALESQNLAGYFVSDLNGTTRQEGAISLDGTTNSWAEFDTTGALRVAAQQSPSAGNLFALVYANGAPEAEMFVTPDGSPSATGFTLLDSNQVERFSAILDSTGSNVDTRDAKSNITGHLP